jgi:hypothetical protein
MRAGGSPTGVCVVSLVVVGNRWVTTVIGPVIPIPDRFESNPTLANGVWIVATMPSRIQSDLEAVLDRTARRVSTAARASTT